MNETPRWIEVRVLAPIGWCEFVAEHLAIGPCTSVVFGRPSLATDAAPDGFDFVRTFIPSHADSPGVREEIEAVMRSLPELTGVDELHSLTLEFRPLPPEDYATSWKKSWKPFRVGRLCVLAPWSESKPRASDIVMHLEPGGAFGSGRHATTRTCMKVLLERIRGGERVLDAGSGSGILGVTAALCGAGSVLGFDVDPNAEPYANELAVNNGVANVCRFKSAGFEAIVGTRGGWDVVLANIYSDIIQAHATTLRDALSPNGWFAFSGCPNHHADATRAAIRSAGLSIDEERVRGRWHTFVGRLSSNE
ncbi:MAG: 50S ribosomal protein L11 methyltransferase [Planctomycetota bacterium]|nr:50S ribosomal protein L11 methyltransferase [Planctomycetota bacterium]